MIVAQKKLLSSIPPVAWLLGLVCLLLVPFANKAFHIDDTLFLRVAEQIQKNPADFYGFKMNWYGDTMPMILNFDNPPLTSYYIAVVSLLFGTSEIVLHLTFLPVAFAAAWGIYTLARQLLTRPLLASACAVLTPVFVISGSNVMCDMMLLTFWVWAVALFHSGVEGDRRAALLGAGVMAGLAGWTKLTGLALVPLFVAYGLLRKKRLGLWAMAPIVTLGFAALLEWIIRARYGQGLLSAAAGVCSSTRPARSRNWLETLNVGLIFAGGCYVSVLFYSVWLWPFQKLVKGLLLLLPLFIIFPYLGRFSILWQADGHPNWALFFETVILLAAGAHVLLLALADVLERRDCTSVLLLLWVGGIFVFATVVNWTVNGRSLLTMAPAVGILVARRLEKSPVPEMVLPSFWQIGSSAAALVLTLWLAKADYDLAGVGRQSAASISSKYLQAGRTLWFEGHWGFQHYMEKAGAAPLDRNLEALRPGDIIVVPSEAVCTFDFSTDLVNMIEVLDYWPNPHLATMSLSAGAGFYAASAGPFPFSIGHIDPERYYVFVVTQTLAQARRAPKGLATTGAVTRQFELERKSARCLEYLRKNPNNAAAQFNMGMLLAYRLKNEEAAEHLTRSLDLNPTNGPAHLELATVLTRQQKLQEAIQHYRAALDLMPDSDRAHNELAAALAAEAGSAQHAALRARAESD